MPPHEESEELLAQQGREKARAFEASHASRELHDGADEAVERVELVAAAAVDVLEQVQFERGEEPATKTAAHEEDAGAAAAYHTPFARQRRYEMCSVISKGRYLPSTPSPRLTCTCSTDTATRKPTSPSAAAAAAGPLPCMDGADEELSTEWKAECMMLDDR
ncbi:hypothetical protein DCS_04320 [Drechmeria coniospora]|uniref:Uncharacterized protein n=1 Tax=Drechmeria coniospora TaxID=98403 RepID=A0A151GJX4_DRECN|nr:hypothetical protein DCS_04320 [Drechmeria coniospora]KYK57312.1 hypothetical protein DCS_04320 [Drechmeria coniospora]